MDQAAHKVSVISVLKAENDEEYADDGTECHCDGGGGELITDMQISLVLKGTKTGLSVTAIMTVVDVQTTREM